MRTVLYQAVKDLFSSDIPEDRILSAASVNEHYETPFIIIRSGERLEIGSGRGTQTVEISFHDGYGSYTRINNFLKKIREGLKAMTPMIGEDGAVLADADWESDSPDLTDDGYGTIYRTSSWSLFGRDGDHPVG